MLREQNFEAGACDLLLRDALCVDDGQRQDLAIREGKIIARGSNLAINPGRVIDANGRLVSPGFVESHLHLDIALMSDLRPPGRLEPFHVMSELGERVDRGLEAFTQEGIIQRSLRALDRALCQGVVALRAQCLVNPQKGLDFLEALLEVKACAAGKVDLQIVALPEKGILGKQDLLRDAIRLGADVIGCSPDLEPGWEHPAVRKAHMDAVFQIAQEFDIDVDTHVDLALLDEPRIEDLDLLYLAEKTIAEGYQGRVTAGHACALDSLPKEIALELIERIAEAGLHVISQPDMYRVGRTDSRHVRRGLTRVKELLAAGVNVSLASNNVRDVLRPMGNFDLLEEALILVYGAHMDQVEQVEDLFRMTTTNPAKALGMDSYGLDVGCDADLVILDTDSPSGAIFDQADKACVLKGGEIMATMTREQMSYSGLI